LNTLKKEDDMKAMDNFTVWMVTDEADGEWASYYSTFKKAKESADELNKAAGYSDIAPYVIEEIEVN
jgi:hypothetical protein